MASNPQEERFRSIFRRAHAGHPGCLQDEWLSSGCGSGDAGEWPLVWSRRNGPWSHVPILWVGAAPGNAGGRGRGRLGAHGTRIPFGGDIAGANLEALLASVGLSRNETFITGSYNRLPERGGGEPTLEEICRPVGELPSSLHLLRETIIATGPRLLVALGNVALRATFGAARVAAAGCSWPSIARVERAGLARGAAREWPAATGADEEFLAAWRSAWGDSRLPAVLWLLHPSAQNMSPFAGEGTAFHRRMVETRAALRTAVRLVLGWTPPDVRPSPPSVGIYALPEWRERIAPRQAVLDGLWRQRGV